MVSVTLLELIDELLLGDPARSLDAPPIGEEFATIFVNTQADVICTADFNRDISFFELLIIAADVDALFGLDTFVSEVFNGLEDTLDIFLISRDKWQ